MDVAEILALAELAYAAAVDDALWRPWTERMISAFGAQGALFWVIDAKRAEMCRSAFHFRDVDLDALAVEYLGGPVHQDPQMRRVLGARNSEVYSDLDHVDLTRADDREYVAWQNARVGTSHHLTASIVLSDTIRAGIALHTSPQAGPASAACRAALVALFPHIARSLKLGLRHNEYLQEAWWDGEQSHAGTASILINEKFQIVRLSIVAESLVRAGDGLSIAENRLKAADAQSDVQLQAAIGQAVRARQSHAGATTVLRPSGRRSYQVLIYPLVRERRFLAPYQAAALIHVIDPCRIRSRLSEMQRGLFGLSDRETDVASLLLSGHSPESLAAVLGISRNTARVHLQSLFRKTGSNRQSELVRILIAAR